MTGIKQLAKSLNMAVSTVSRALNDSPQASPGTKKLVREAAARLGYEPNQAGRSLRKKTTGTIGFMLQTGIDVTAFGDGFFMSVFDGVQTVLARHELDLVALLCSADQDRETYLRRAIAKDIVDGYIISHTDRVDNRIEMLAKAKRPFVTMGRSTIDAGQPWIDADVGEHARIAIARLAGKGHRRLSLALPDDEINLGYERLSAVQTELAFYGLELDPECIFRVPASELGGARAAERFAALRQRPTATILSSEYQTGGFYHGLESHGIRPGIDVAVIGFVGPMSRYFTPPLTGFRQNPRKIGIDLAEALLSRIPAYGQLYPDRFVRKLWPLELVTGESDDVSVGPAIHRAADAS